MRDGSGRPARRVLLGAVSAMVLLLGAWCALAPRPEVAAPSRSAPPPTPAPTGVVAVPPDLRTPSSRVECQLSDPLDPAVEVWVEELDPDTLEQVERHLAAANGAWIQFTPSNAVGVGYLHTRRHQPRPMGWMDGACIDLLVLEPLPTRTVRGHVSGQIEVGGVAVHARCGGGRGGFSGSLSSDGGFVLELPTDEDCTLEVRRVFGDDVLTAEAAQIPAGEGELDGLTFEVPVAPGAGVGLFRVDRGLRVQDLEADGPAARAGLQRFDLVLSVDGVPADQLDLASVQPLEPPARLEVERDGEILELVVH